MQSCIQEDSWELHIASLTYKPDWNWDLANCIEQNMYLFVSEH